ncbi:MAG: hypothetical protein NT173_13555 [Opitutales bacterium]|nr:hypothetical protein [Opitutales bacterium]
MHNCETTQGTPPQRRARQGLALLLSALVPVAVGASMRQWVAPDTADCPDGAAPAAYLPLLGAAPLRFADVVTAPDRVARPAATAPPQPGLTRTESSVALANAAAAQSAALNGAGQVRPPPISPEGPDGTPPADQSPPLPILPDEVRPQLHPEDFLPFFQLPGSATSPGGVILVGPLPTETPPAGPRPQSSATYHQTPK